MNALVTGCAGFIGYHLTMRLLNDGYNVVGIDNINDYYDVGLKNDRLKDINNNKPSNSNYNFFQIDLEDYSNLDNIFKKFNPEVVINLAAQAGVRNSIKKPLSYINSNLVGFANILEFCRKYEVGHLVYASSSSVYGGNTSLPFKELDNVDHPVSLYAATKKSNELMAHCYSHLYQIPTTGLRFFTVYGPWGRPDMALFLFTKAIINKKPIEIFNNGEMLRDFTYIDDIIESLTRVILKRPTADNSFNKESPMPSNSWAPYRIFNIGNSNPTNLMDFISCIEKELEIKAIKTYYPMQPGDIKSTYADSLLLENWINFKPGTSIENGVKKFIDWYRSYY
tara:strand:- start:9044 stop:10057 length:1014 start_codon:yes stop_codon:yes gene_type:complete